MSRRTVRARARRGRRHLRRGRKAAATLHSAALAMTLACDSGSTGEADDARPPPEADAPEAGPLRDARPGDAGLDGSVVRYTENREPCGHRNALRNVYYGDLHVHTAYSFDAYLWATRADPAGAYAFARGEPLSIPPLDESGKPTRTIRLETPLDFAAVTDHAEFLGEIDGCVDPESPSYATDFCEAVRQNTPEAVAVLGAETFSDTPRRIGGCDANTCPPIVRSVWQRIQEQTEAAYDRTSRCEFTALHGYEWTANTGGSNLHRNVIYRNDAVPPLPISYYDATSADALWSALDQTCDADAGCEVLAIPHNSNLSNGAMFAPPDPTSGTLLEQRRRATLRARTEPLVEIFQHKGSSECSAGLSGILGQPDELCAVEEIRRARAEDCGDAIGSLGIVNQGCVSRYDFVRNALLVGLAEAQRLGINPLRLGIIASTDTHSAAAGATDEADYPGHIGSEESTPESRLGPGFAQPSGVIGNPGGLAGVWAVENSRDAIFEAFQRRETFGTSGTRIAPRFFGGYDYAASLCDDPEWLETAYRDGTPMGGDLGPPPSEAKPRFLASAFRDPSSRAAPLQRLQIVKGWVDASGALRYQVFDVAGDGGNGAGVDEATCKRSGTGAASLCAVWEDEDFDAQIHAYYYLRVVENPSCRWSWHECLRLPVDERPAACSDREVPRTVQEMAWSSPVWYRPPH